MSFNSFNAANNSKCVEACTDNGDCYVVSFTESNKKCELYALASNGYAFASPNTTLFFKELKNNG
jgi:hypothetical protein